MRVALVHRNFGLAGSLERHSVFLAEILARRGVEVHCYGNPDSLTADLGDAAFHPVRPLVRSSSRFGLPLETGSFAVRATRALRRDRGRYDVVHVSGVAAWEQDVVTVHAVAKAEQARWPAREGAEYRAARLRSAAAPVLRPQVSVWRAVERRQFRGGNCARVIAVTPQVRDDLIAVHGVGPDKIDVMPYPIDLERIVNASSNHGHPLVAIRGDQARVLFVGHDFARKGLGELIEALPPEAHLIVAGSGDRAPFEKIAQRHTALERVHFLGAVDEPERLYGAADALVLPTRNDAWGIPVIEAMAAGLPVITTSAAGVADVVRRSRAGIVIDPSAPERLRESLARLLANPTLRREMGDRGRGAAKAFGIEAYGDKLLAVYDAAREARGRAPKRAM